MIKKILAFSAVALFSFPAMAEKTQTTISALSDVPAIARVNPEHNQQELYKACATIYGTFNSNTMTLKVSTDGGTTKVPMPDLSGTTYTATANDAVCWEWGFGRSSGESTIFYLSTGGAASAPSLTVDVFDNR